jgi:hypothetical protein
VGGGAQGVPRGHPDLLGGDPEAEGRLKALNAAWESVNTPSKWAAFLLEPASGGSGPARRPGAPPTVGRLRVQRQQRGSAGMLNWNLELDGEVVARIENGGSSVLDAAPGRHSLRVFYGRHSSLPLGVQLHRGQEVRLGCRQLESLRVSLFSPERALVLELLGRGPFV